MNSFACTIIHSFIKYSNYLLFAQQRTHDRYSLSWWNIGLFFIFSIKTAWKDIAEIQYIKTTFLLFLSLVTISFYETGIVWCDSMNLCESLVITTSLNKSFKTIYQIVYSKIKSEFIIRPENETLNAILEWLNSIYLQGILLVRKTKTRYGNACLKSRHSRVGSRTVTWFLFIPPGYLAVSFKVRTIKAETFVS